MATTSVHSRYFMGEATPMSFPYIPLVGAQFAYEFLQKFGEVYDRRCIADEQCPTEERIAATYDYVGAVYGPAGQGRYDHVLMDSERKYVEQTFGRLTAPLQIGAYFSNAHSIFFRQFPTPKQCPEGPPVTLLHPQLGAGLVLYGAHGCGEAHGKQLSQSGLELAMAANPPGWTFFIEGAQPTEWLENPKQLEMGPEVKLLQRIAEVLHIPIKEALAYNPTHPQVLEAAAKKSGYRREELIVGAVFQVFISYYLENRGVDQNSLMTHAVEKTAPYFEMNPQKLAEEMNVFLRKYGQGQVNESKKRMEILVDVANELSTAPLRKELETLAKGGPSKALFLVGQKHLELVKGIYTE